VTGVAVSVVSFAQLSTHRAAVGNSRFEDDHKVFDMIFPVNKNIYE
jgi:hypothetical protein